jgi:hypothetical protein
LLAGFTNIVGAVDGSEQAVLALDYASQLAQRDGAELQVAAAGNENSCGGNRVQQRL